MPLFEARLFSFAGFRFNLFNSICSQRHYSTQINKQIIQRIKINGPLPVSEFMKIVLTSPLTVRHRHCVIMAHSLYLLY